MSRLTIVVLLLLAGCTNDKNELTFTRSSDPVWAINPDQWFGPTQTSARLTKGN